MIMARVVIIMYMGTVMYVQNRVGTIIYGHKYESGESIVAYLNIL